MFYAISSDIIYYIRCSVEYINRVIFYKSKILDNIIIATDHPSAYFPSLHNLVKPK